jgi:predicted PurR-regulated permease PerM
MLLPWQKESTDAVRPVETGSQPSNVESVSHPVRTRVQTRTVALVALAVVVASFALHAGAVFFIPVVTSVFLSYALSPVVAFLERWRVPRALASVIAVVLVIIAASVVVQQTINSATEVLDELPQAVQKLRYAITSWERDGRGPLKQVSKTADELQKLAGATASATTATPPAANPPAAAAAAGSKTLFAAGTTGMAMFIGELASVLFLSYFLLAAGDLFRRRLLQMIGSSFATRRKALTILRQVQLINQRYFAVVLAVNVAVGIATGIGLYFLGVRHPVFWGIAIAVLHIIPYIGAAVVVAAVGLTAFAQFENLGLALAAASVPLLAASLIGIWLQTALLGRTARMNAVVVFGSLLFWGMVWGGWGLILAFPMVATAKIVFGEIDRLKPVALLMSD